MALLPVLFGWPALLFPMHIALLELVIDPVCALAFEAAPGEAAAMQRPPRRASEPLFGLRQLAGAAFAGLVVANLTFAFVASTVPGQGLLDRSRRSFWAICALALAVLCGVLAIPAWGEMFSVALPPPVWLVIALTAGAGAGALALRLSSHDRA
jgi:Ca2+-transporting ATPase